MSESAKGTLQYTKYVQNGQSKVQEGAVKKGGTKPPTPAPMPKVAPQGIAGTPVTKK